MKEGYKDIDDILKEVAEDENMTIKEVRDLWEHQKLYIKKQMDEEGVYSIFLPYIGTLSLNVTQVKKEIQWSVRQNHVKFLEKVEALKNHEKFNLCENSHKRVTGVNRLARYIIKNFYSGIESVAKLIKHKECWEVIEKHSNSPFDKREKQLSKEQIKKNKNDKYKKHS